jgi:hypothetical protein
VGANQERGSKLLEMHLLTHRGGEISSSHRSQSPRGAAQTAAVRTRCSLFDSCSWPQCCLLQVGGQGVNEHRGCYGQTRLWQVAIPISATLAV